MVRFRNKPAKPISERGGEAGAERLFRHLAETTPAGIFVHQGGRFCYANPAGEAISGYSLSELVNMAFWDVVHPNFRELVKNRGLARMRREPVLGRYEIKIITKAGDERWVDLTATSIDFHGELAVLGTVFDISDRKRAEEALRAEMVERRRLEAELRRSQEQLQAVLDNTTAVIYVKDLQGRYVLINRRFEMLFRVTKSYLVGKTDYDIFPSETADRFRANDVQVERLGRPMEFEEFAPHEDGMHAYISLKFPLHDSSGRAYAVCGISTDITERKLAEEALRESEAKYRTLVETAHDLIWSIDPEGQVTFMNKKGRDLLGYTEEEVLGRPFTDFVAGGDAEKGRMLLRAALGGKDYQNYEAAVIAKDGRAINLNFNGTALRDGEGKAVGVMGTAQDITERKRLECLKRSFSQRLLQTLEDERRRVARELHDNVGQSLATIGLQIHGLLHGEAKNHQNLARALGLINEAVRNTTESTARLARDYHPAELSDLGVSSAICSFAREFAERHGLGIVLGVDSLDGLLDEDQELHLYRIVQEALNNVAKHARARQVRVFVKRCAENVVASVEDDGRGVTPKLLGGQPRGLGFTTMTERAAILGGRFTVGPALPSGTRVEVRIPLSQRSGFQVV